MKAHELGCHGAGGLTIECDLPKRGLLRAGVCGCSLRHPKSAVVAGGSWLELSMLVRHEKEHTTPTNCERRAR